MDAWQPTIAAVRAGKIEFRIVETGCPGTNAIEAITPGLPYPIAVVWFRFRNHYAIDIMNSWTFDPLRRLGLRTYLHRRMIECWPSVLEVYSAAATPSGEAWMLAAGYKKCWDGWRYRVPKRKKPGPDSV